MGRHSAPDDQSAELSGYGPGRHAAPDPDEDAILDRMSALAEPRGDDATAASEAVDRLREREASGDEPPY